MRRIMPDRRLKSHSVRGYISRDLAPDQQPPLAVFRLVILASGGRFMSESLNGVGLAGRRDSRAAAQSRAV